MSHRSGSNEREPPLLTTVSDSGLLKDLLGWGRLLSGLVEALDPFYRVEDLLQTEHPLADSEEPLGAVVRRFGKGSIGSSFLTWWIGDDPELSSFDSTEQIDGLIPLTPLQRQRATALQSAALSSFEAFDGEWVIQRDRLLYRGSGREAIFGRPLAAEHWEQIELHLSDRAEAVQAASMEGLDDAIDRVRSFFEPLESPLFGMDLELLTHHVHETIPREGHTETLTPIVPLFGKGHPRKAFPSTAQLPAHLRVILHRLLRSQQNDDLVTSLLATLEAIDFSLRFATGIGQGNIALLENNDFEGTFNPTTLEIIKSLEAVVEAIPKWSDDPRAQATWNLLYQGDELHSFLQWGGIGGERRLIDWMRETEEAIREDDPAGCASLLSEVMAHFNAWTSELTLLCSSWDMVTHVRQDGYLQINLGRGDVWFSCKPLIDPTRYSVWLDRSELTLVNKGGSLHAFLDSKEPVESLDERLTTLPDDPPFLREQLSALVRAHEQGQILPLGRALFFGLEYLVRLHASLAGGYLQHSYQEMSQLDPVRQSGGPLEYVIYFLSYSQRLLGERQDTEAKMLRSVFFEGDEPREFSVWLGLDGKVPGPLQGLLGWSLSLMRPDAKTRLDEVRGQVDRLSRFFADFLEQSRELWKKAALQTDAVFEGGEAVVLTFPSGLCLRGFPDVAVGPRLVHGTRSVVVDDRGEHEEHFSSWEEDESLPPLLEEPSEEIDDEPSWPSFFDDTEDTNTTWPKDLHESISRFCQARDFSGPDARPRVIAEEIASVVSRDTEKAAGVLFCRGGAGVGKTFLCRTLTNPACTPLAEDFPVLYLSLDRFPRTRLATVVERLNDHIASEQSMERFSWDSIPLESLKSLGTEVVRLSDELAGLGVSSEPLANRLSSYLRHLKKLNGNRSFLIVLDGFDEIPKSIVPSSMPPGVHLLITGTSIPEFEVPPNPYMEFHTWELSGPSGEETFARQVRNLDLDDTERKRAHDRLRGSLFLARVFRDLRNLHEEYPLSGDVLGDLLAEARAKFSEPEKYQEFLRLLTVLGLYERPVPLASLQKKVTDAAVVLKAIELFPSLFSFWNEPTPSLGLGHTLVMDWIERTEGVVEAVAQDLAESFLETPRRGELLSVLHWFERAEETIPLMESFFAEPDTAALWREELASLNDRGLFFQRVALLDAMAVPLVTAVEQGAGNLREELAWVYNARGLSLLALGLESEAMGDFDAAVVLFTEQFASGDLNILEALASALSRRAEAALESGDLTIAADSSERALELLEEKMAACVELESVAELHSRVLFQSARTALARRESARALTHLEKALSNLEEVVPARRRRLQGECSLAAAQALTSDGSDREAIAYLDTAVDLLLASKTIDLGLHALLKRAFIQTKLANDERALADLKRALSILRYQVAMGRLDLEPVLAFTIAQLSTIDLKDRSGRAAELGDYIRWAGRRIRYEGRTDLRGLLAHLLTTRSTRLRALGYFSRAVTDLRAAAEQYDLLSHELSDTDDIPVWSVLDQSFRHLTTLYLSLDEPQMALICGQRALELGRRMNKTGDSVEESIEIVFRGETHFSEPVNQTREERFFQLGRLYFDLGRAARRMGLMEEGGAYLERSVRALSQALSCYDEVPEHVEVEYALVLKRAALAASQDGNVESLEGWLEALRELSPGLVSDFDNYLIRRWSGQSAVRRGDLSEAKSLYEEALSALAPMLEHPRRGSLEAESLLDLGRVLSLEGDHDRALEILDRANDKAQDAIFVEGEETKDLLVLCALHTAVAHLRAGNTPRALEQLRFLVSNRPGLETHEVEELAKDWVEAWEITGSLREVSLLNTLGQLSELGDWLLRTSLGRWYRSLVCELLEDPRFETVITSCTTIDRVLESYLVLTFSSGVETDRTSTDRELEKLLAAKFRAFDSENRDLEAELLLSHLLPVKRSSESGAIFLRRSEMALLRGDRGLAIVDLLHAIDGGGEYRLQAHLRLAEFLQSRGLNSAAVHHLYQSLLFLSSRSEGVSSLCGRCCRLFSRLARETVEIELDFYRQHFRILAELEQTQLTPTLDLAWLRPIRDPQQWLEIFDLTLAVLTAWQKMGHDKPADWVFFEEVVDRTVLCHGKLPMTQLEDLGRILSAALSVYDVQNRDRASDLWERFVSFLPSWGKRTAVELLERLIVFTRENSREPEQTSDLIKRLEREKRILIQPY